MTAGWRSGRSRGFVTSAGADTVIAMDWPAFWIAAFESSGAALIGLTSAVLVFRRTRAADRRDAAVRARRERIAAAQAALWGDLAQRLGWRWRPLGTAPLPLVKALADIIVAESAEHPAIALWTTEQVHELTERLRSAERGWLLPGDQKRRGQLVESASTAVSMLAGWEAGAIEDDWFTTHLSESNGKLLTTPKSRKLLRRRAGRSPLRRN